MCECTCCVRYGPLPERKRPSLTDAFAEYMKIATDSDKKRVYHEAGGKKDGTAAG